MDTNPQPEMEISFEAKEAARKCAKDEPDHLAATAEYYYGVIVQDAINQSTAPLREEIERLKEANSGIPHVYKRLMKMSPWTESNDMNWEDEMDCGFNGLQERLVEQENQITQLEKQVLGLKEFLRDVESNWDCDNGAHGTHSPHCRACKAKELLLGMTDTSARYIKREVLEKCVHELHKQIKHLHSSSAYYQSGQATLTLANEELKKGQRE